MAILLAVISAVCPIIGLPLTLILFKDKKYDKICALLCGLAFAALLYGYKADSGNDIYRHIANLEYYRHVSFFRCFDAGALDNLYTWDIWQWIVARFSDANLLQASGAFVGYTLASYLVFNYAKRNSLTGKKWMAALILMYSVLSPLGMAVGIRNSNAFVIMAYAIYRYYGEHGKWYTSACICLIAILLHHSALLVVVLWIVLPFFKRHRIVCGILIAFSTFSFNNYGFYLSLLSGSNSTLSGLLADTMNSAVAYQTTSLMSFHNRFSILVGVCVCVLMLVRSERPYSYLMANKRNDSVSCAESMWNISLMNFITAICLLFQIGVNGSRYVGFSTQLLFVPLLVSMGKISFMRNKRYFILDSALLISIIGSAVLQIYDLAWGSASISSLFAGFILGFFNRNLFI